VSDCAATSERAFGPSLPRARTAEQARHSLTGRNLTGTAVNMTTARQDFEEAVRLLREGRDDEAAARCEEALRRAPDDVNLLALLGAVHLRRRDPEAAVPFLRRAVALWPDFARAHEDLGTALFAMGNAEGAAASLERAAKLAPGREPVFSRLARVYLALGRGAEA